DEASDVRVVERGLDLVEEIERTRPSEEEREEERDRAQRLLAAGEQRKARHLLAGGTELDLDARGLVLLLGVGQAQPALAAGEQRRRALGEVRLDVRERLGEPLLDRARQVVAQLLELREARLEVLPLRRELDQPFLLLFVLLLRQRIDL